jgi:hypothetical protein
MIQMTTVPAAMTNQRGTVSIAMHHKHTRPGKCKAHSRAVRSHPHRQSNQMQSKSVCDTLHAVTLSAADKLQLLGGVVVLTCASSAEAPLWCVYARGWGCRLRTL